MTQFEVDCLYRDIKRDAAKIMKAAEGGCSKAQNVIALHKMCVARADIPTVTLLRCAYNDYCNT